MPSPWSNQIASLIVVTASTGFTGIFMYSPNPGAGNLIFSVTAAAGTDPFGNAYIAGLQSGFDGSSQVFLNPALGLGWNNLALTGIGIVQTSGVSGQVVTTLSATLHATGTGNMIACTVRTTHPTLPVISSMNVGAVAMTQLATGNDYSVGGGDTWWSFYIPSSTSGATSAAVTFSGSVNIAAMRIWEVSGLAGSTTTQTNSGPSNTNTFASGSITPTGPAFFWGTVQGSGSGGVPPVGWTYTANIIGSSPYGTVGYIISNTAQNYKGNFGGSFNIAGISCVVSAAASVTSALQAAAEFSNQDSGQTVPGIIGTVLFSQGGTKQQPAEIITSPISTANQAFGLQLASESNDGSLPSQLEFGTTLLTPGGGSINFTPVAFLNSSGALTLNQQLIQAAVTAPAGPGTGFANLYVDTAGYWAMIDGQGLAQNLSGSTRTGVNTHTVTAASFGNLADVTTLFPANDPEVGSTYEFEAWGTAVWGSTVQALTFQMTLGGVSFNTIAIAATAFVASANVNWYARAIFKCVTTGSSGTWNGVLTGVINVPTGGLLPGTGVSDTVPFSRTVSPAVTVSTIVAQAAAIQAEWGSITGAPTITAITGNGPKRIA